MNLISTFIALGIGNYSYQWLTGEANYDIALERTYFMGAALLIYWLVNLK